ncbi:MAG TPA: hypothetical protein VFF73_18810 [Planctomycetota bacterium]|nr:hypothetical protein [Planctomycetota bacterium]
MKSRKSILLTAAVSGLLVTGSGCGGGEKKPDSTSSTASDKHVCKGKAADGKNDCASADYKHACGKQNACKGQGGCKSGDAGCAGKNTCKGKGGCQVPVKPM